MFKSFLRPFAFSLSLLLVGAGTAGAVDVASVNGERITLEEVNRAVQLLPEFQKLQQEVVNRLIVNKIYIQESKKAGIKVEASQVEDGLAQLRANVRGGEEAFSALLKARGTTEAELKEGIRTQLLVNAYLKSVDEKVSTEVSQDELKRFYSEQPSLFSKPEKVKVRHIQVMVPTDASKDVVKKQLAKIEAIEKELKAGKDFEALAKEKSDASDRVNGGVVGYITRGSKVAKSLLDAAFSLKKGERSGVIRSLDGFHILEVMDRTSEVVLSFDEVKGSIKNNIIRERVASNRLSHEQLLLQKASIKDLTKK